MAYLRYLIFLFASSMVVKIPLMALFHELYLLVTGDPWIGSADAAMDKILRSELLFFIPLYLIYLPLFIYNIKTYRTESRFMYWDMSMICMIVCPLTFGILLDHGISIALSAAAFVGVYFILTAILHLHLCHAYILRHIYGSPADIDKTLPEYAEWQAKIKRLQNERQEKYDRIYAEKKEKKSEQGVRNKIGWIFFCTDFSAYLIIAFILYYAMMAAMLIYDCNKDPILTVCSYDFLLEALDYIGTQEAMAGVFLAILTIYTPSYLLYVPLTRKLWHLQLHSFAHFGLASCPAIFLCIINTMIFSTDTAEENTLTIFGISSLLLLKSSAHLAFLKLYDKYIGIPEEPPKQKRWYNRFFGKTAAEA